MLSAFTARPIIELKQRDKSKIESILAYGMPPRFFPSGSALAYLWDRRSCPRRSQHRCPPHLPIERTPADDKARQRESVATVDAANGFKCFRAKLRRPVKLSRWPARNHSACCRGPG